MLSDITVVCRYPEEQKTVFALKCDENKLKTRSYFVINIKQQQNEHKLKSLG